MVMTLMSNPRGAVGTVVIATDGSGDYNTDGTDDNVEIQAAIDSLPAGGGCIYIKEGIYEISATIRINVDSVKIHGCGRSTQFLANGAGAIINLWDANYCSIRDIYLNGNSIAGLGIYLVNASRGFFNNIWIEEINGDGIFILSVAADINSSRNTITNNKILNCNGNGMEMIVVSIAQERNIIAHNLIENSGENGIFISVESLVAGVLRHTIISNNIILNADSGDTGTYSGIKLETDLQGTIHYNIITENVCSECGAYGIELEDTWPIDHPGNYSVIDENIITGNSCVNNGIAPIRDVGANTGRNQIFNNVEV